jgi:hypothetical protein
MVKIMRTNGFRWVYEDLKDSHSLLNQKPACYCWELHDHILYVGETGRNVPRRMADHLKDAANPKHPYHWRKWSLLYDNPYTTRVRVYVANKPLFYNSLCVEEFRLFSQATASARRLEEAAVVQFFSPLINS